MIANISAKVHDTQTPALKLSRVEKCVYLNSDVLQKTRPNFRMEKEDEHEVPPLAENLLALDSCWQIGSNFSIRGLSLRR